LPGETVEVEGVAGHPDRRRLLRVEQPSAERIAPICPHFGVCGGCALQHWDAARYRAWKRDLVVEALASGRPRRARSPTSLTPTAKAAAGPYSTRGAGRDDVLEVGFSAPRAHHVVAIDRCPILAPKPRRRAQSRMGDRRSAGVRRKSRSTSKSTATDAGLDVDVRGSGPLTPTLMTALARIAAKHDLARLTRHGELIALAARPDVAAWVKPPCNCRQRCFCKRQPKARKRWHGSCSSSCAGAATVADLFAGVGPFALRLAERARVTAVDDDQAALSSLKQCHRVHCRPQADGRSSDAICFKNPLGRRRNSSDFDAVVFDPPRQGAAGAVARACGKRRSGRRGRIMQCGDVSPVTCASYWSMAAIGSPRSRRSINSATLRMSRSSRGCRGSAPRPGFFA
jgi:23S rRNA (uracil1939-C5)-methyltransferase